MSEQARTQWRVETFRGKDEPYLCALLKYRAKRDRRQVQPYDFMSANLVSSRTTRGNHMPIIDLDIPHHILPSSREGHSHLYLDVPISRTRWTILMWGLYVAGVVDKGFFYWSLRRGMNFARVNSVKTEEELTFRSTYGWLFKKRRYRTHWWHLW